MSGWYLAPRQRRVEHRQHVVRRRQGQHVGAGLRREAEVAGVHVAVGDQAAEPPQVVDALHVVSAKQAGRVQQGGEPGPVGRAPAEQGGIQCAQAEQRAASERTMAVEALDFQKRASVLHHDAAARTGRTAHFVTAGQCCSTFQRQVFANQQVGPALHGWRAVGARELDQHVWRLSPGPFAQRRELGELARRAGARHAGGYGAFGQARIRTAHSARLDGCRRFRRRQLVHLPAFQGGVAQDQVATYVAANAAEHVCHIVIGPLIRVG